MWFLFPKHGSWSHRYKIIVTTFDINRLLTATAVVFQKLLQWSILRTLSAILFLLLPYVWAIPIIAEDKQEQVGSYVRVRVKWGKHSWFKRKRSVCCWSCDTDTSDDTDTTAIPETFEDLSLNLISILPKAYLRIDLVLKISSKLPRVQSVITQQR